MGTGSGKMTNIENPTRIRRTHSIGFRLSLLVSIAIMLFGAVSIYIVVNRQDRLYMNEKEKQWETLINSLTPNLTNMLASNDLSGISAILDKTASSREDLAYIYLCNENNEVVFSSDMSVEGSMLPTDTLAELSLPSVRDKETGSLVIQFVREIKSGTSRLGSFYMGFNYLPSLEKEQLTKILTLEDAIQNAVKKYLLDLDFYQVHFVTTEMIKDIKDVSYFKVVRSNGTIVSSPDEKEILKQDENEYNIKVLEEASTRKPVWIRKLELEHTSILEVTLVIFEGSSKLGLIQVGHDLSALEASVKREKYVMAGIVMTSVFLAMLVAMIIASRISNPVVHLVSVAQEVGKGNLEAKAMVQSGGDELRMLGGAFNQMVKGLKERDLVKDTFSRYVTRQVADELLNNPDMVSLGGKKQEVTILFSDIRGFTTFSESHSPEEVLAHLNEYLGSMVDVIFKYEGTLDKFIGDAIMAVFGSPLPHKDDPARAVRTAWEMQCRLVNLNEKWLKEGKTPLKIGIGVNTGDVIVGNIGDVRRMEYTVIGDNVNLASRIEGLTKNFNCPIIISESTYEKVKDIAEVTVLEAVTVKGKTKPVNIYELTGIKDS